VIEDVFSGVVPQGHIVNRTVTFHSERTSHDPSKLSKQVANSKIQDLTPNADLYRLISRTVVYGPVRTVVWEGGRCEASSLSRLGRDFH